ncbi:hypothetical protein BH24BAC1_BH24BAC1_28920 [soil metagenome]
MNRTDDNDPYSEQKAQAPGGSSHREQRVIPIIEEQVRIEKRVTETGSVNISKRVHQEEVTVDEPIVEEQVEVERVPVNQYVESAPPAVRYEGDTMIVPVLREVVEKRLILVEEIRITKRQEKTHEPQQVTLCKEEVRVNRDSGKADQTR